MSGSGLQPVYIVPFIACFILSIGLHEAMHAFAAHRLGDRTAKDLGRVTLNPLKHIDFFTTIALPLVLLMLHLPPFLIARPVPVDFSKLRHGEYGGALVGIAGPFTNLALACIGATILKVGSFVPGGFFSEVLILFVMVNVGTFVFNMIPFPPLDGSRLLYAFAPRSLQRVMAQIESFGLAGIFVFMFLVFPLLQPVISMINTSLLRFLLA